MKFHFICHVSTVKWLEKLFEETRKPDEKKKFSVFLGDVLEKMVPILDLVA